MTITTFLQPPLLPLFLLFLLFLLLNPLSSAASDDNNSTSDYIRSSCTATLYPDICYTSLSRYASAVQQSPSRLAVVAVGVSLSRASRTARFVADASSQADYGSDRRAASALHDCLSSFGDAVDEIRGSLKQMQELGESSFPSSSSAEEFRFQMSNVQTWMSAALTDEETCTDGLQDVDDGEVKEAVCKRAEVAKKFTSNALALVNTYAAAGIP
ncbi:Pectinesterase inhibitor 7 [Linum perenne]